MEHIAKILEFLSSIGFDNIIAALLQIIGGFALIATFTVNKTDDKIISAISKLINFLGANFGEAKNKEAKKDG